MKLSSGHLLEIVKYRFLHPLTHLQGPKKTDFNVFLIEFCRLWTPQVCQWMQKSVDSFERISEVGSGNTQFTCFGLRQKMTLRPLCMQCTDEQKMVMKN